MRTQVSAIAIAFASCLLPQHLHAQARSDTEAIAVAVVLKQCPLTSSDLLASDAKDRPVEMAPVIGAFLAGVAGDAVAAGVNALGAALEEASREKGFSAVAATSFAFYQAKLEADRTVKFSARVQPGGSLCLVAALPMPPSDAKKLAAPTADEITGLGLQALGINEWQPRGLPANPAVYLEIALQRREDGFVARPALIWYRHAFAGAPTRALPVEVHIAFSIPTSPGAEQTSTFALSRIRLPPMAPGELMTFNDLRLYEGEVLPMRPVSGSADATKSEFTSVVTEIRESEKEARQLNRQVLRARKVATGKNATKEDRQKLDELEDKLADATLRTAEADRKLKGAIARNEVHKGSTNVSVRFTVVRDANKFGLAIAKSLQDRSKALGEGVTSDLMPKSRAEAWTEKDTNYVTAMSSVESAQHTLEGAIAKGDVDAEFAARLALKNAKAAANAAAAASGRSLPYPDIL